MRFTPGCKCCGCVPDANHVCICTCPSPISKTASVGDDLGTQVLTYGPLPGSPGPSGNGWRSPNIVVSDVQTYLSSLGMCLALDRDGVHDKTNYRYALSFNCGVGWKLWEYIEIVSCKETSSGPFSPHYAWPGDTARIFQVVSHEIGFECSPDMLAFTLPDNYFGLALPGGGGSLSVVFDE